MKLLVLILILCFTVKADPLKPLPIDFLDKKEIKYNKFYYNSDLLKNNKITNTIENVNAISSYNSPESWYEFIESNVDNNILAQSNLLSLLKRHNFRIYNGNSNLVILL